MRTVAGLIRGRGLSWSTRLVVGSVALVAVSFALFSTMLAPLALTTVGAVGGGTGFVLGVSASISAFLERDAYADSDFYR
jgi:multidrug transporter EmrE-like cation transporter